MSQILQADVVDLFYGAISQDATIKNTSGIKIDKLVDRRALASTPSPDQGNKHIIISKQRSGPFEWNCGGLAGQVHEFVKIETIVKTVEGNEDARQVIDTLRVRIKEVLFSAQFLGTGWLMHKIVQDQFPSAPMKTRAYHVLVYDVMVTMGVKS